MTEKYIKIKFNPNDTDFVKIGKYSYFVFENSEGAYLLPATCPHKGGPLHFGKLKKHLNKWYIQCPWHDKMVDLSYLISKGISLVKSNDTNDTLIFKLSAKEYKKEDIVFSKRNLLVINNYDF